VSLLEIAAREVGTEEEPRNSNWGPKVKEYLAMAGITSPAPWCMAFVVWCFRQAGFAHDKLPTTASCTFLLNWAREKGKLVKQPQPGDIFLLLRPGGRTAFHTGIVKSVGTLNITTIEGNSNSVGSPEGYAVVSRQRNKLVRIAFVRIG
jgi:hypothetical protein